ncbi:hypothetical protein ACJJI5_19585 [Microbulbifer sp. EKSA008]|uniref:hypothetical protein n=1 Tax=Microbulbifer TaxID=48073 RepID=UPI0003A9F3F0|nr:MULTISPECIES: hypothetical protein [Microbulbifer]WHI48520.1 hypothetical protein P0078_09145 [Microbulbifer sp. VAAF005]WHI50385.1 hypothetical protein P3339_18350 [Microbulbifer sp. MLAF003]WNZ57275.1 hypothetical protein QT397_08030 [Microbulbifer sp. MKSA007]
MNFTPAKYLIGIISALVLAGCCSPPAPPAYCPPGAEQIPLSMACPADADCWMASDRVRCMKVVK